MKTLQLKNQTPDGLISELDLGGFKASWVGEYPSGQGIAFGAEDGRILLVQKDGEIVGGLKPESEETINGLAFLPGWMGISTRDEVCFVDFTSILDPTVVRIPYGSHGVIVGPHGHFLAPLGANGLLSFKPTKVENPPVTISRPPKTDLYFYRVICLIGPTGQHVVAVATRGNGIAAMPFDSPERGIHTLTFEAFDAIDLCPLGPSCLAVAALGKDGTIMMCRDVIEETVKRQASVTTRFADIRGTAYRVLNAMGSLIVFTSQATYFLGEMAENFLHGKTGPVTILEFPIKAVDANIVNEHWLMIVTARGVLRLDLRLLNWSEQHQNGREHRVRDLTPLSPIWQGTAVSVASHAA